MDQVVTVGMILKPALVIVGVLLALGVVVWILSVVASGFDH
jgi:hypothetical protein